MSESALNLLLFDCFYQHFDQYSVKMSDTYFKFIRIKIFDLTFILLKNGYGEINSNNFLD